MIWVQSFDQFPARLGINRTNRAPRAATVEGKKLRLDFGPNLPMQQTVQMAAKGGKPTNVNAAKRLRHLREVVVRS